MPLPKTVTPKFNIKLPSTGKDVTFRPFLVREEKALLIAAEGGDQDSIVRAIKDAISACVDDVDVSKLPFFDVEYLFLNLRAKSVGEDVKFTYRHKGGVNREGTPCDAATEVVINIDEVKIQNNPDHKTRIMIDDKYGFKMKYPTIDMIREASTKTKDELLFMASCVEFVYDETQVYEPDSLEETVAFIEGLNSKQYEKLSQFFETMPKLQHEVTYSCRGCGQVDTVTFEGVNDFF